MIGEEGQTILNLAETLKLRHLQSIVELVATNVRSKTLMTLLPKMISPELSFDQSNLIRSYTR